MSSISRVADYSVVERLRDGSEIEIRSLHPADKREMLAAVKSTSIESLERRFFVPKRHFSDKEVEFFMNVDFKSHVALIAKINANGRRVIAGGGRYIMVEPGRAEMAFAVVDAYQKKGIGAVLMRHLVAIARDEGLTELIADVLPENAAILRLFGRFGFHRVANNDHQVRHLVLRLA
jgi:GNAT superfamily N-acetyltransferase